MWGRAISIALYFYLNLFAITFFTFASFSFLNFFGGASEPRVLASLALQIGLAMPILYGFNFASRQKVRMSGLAQGVLYIAGVYSVLQAFINAALAYLSFRGAVSHGELDIVSTEIERCLSSYSFVYWLMRGDLQFVDHQPASLDWVDVARDYALYVLILPFCVIFAKLMIAGTSG
jgi:hypothetical protein